mmetsp:Transcript_18142/g.24963  ORF Transcript_18142/g.24963 Transcript_18142/m.24963 type:complete len:81 (-) Transcript_18142:1153-1395(-)
MPPATTWSKWQFYSIDKSQNKRKHCYTSQFSQISGAMPRKYPPSHVSVSSGHEEQCAARNFPRDRNVFFSISCIRSLSSS